MASFDIAYPKLRRDEGGKVDLPVDHRTNAGVTQESYDTFCKMWNKPAKDVFDMTEDEIMAFYITEYWIPLRGKMIGSQGLADLLFSMAVLQGRKTAVRRLQGLLGVATDGIMGAGTLAAIEAADAKTLIRSYADANRAFYKLLGEKPRYAAYLAGWLNRVDRYT